MYNKNKIFIIIVYIFISDKYICSTFYERIKTNFKFMLNI